VEPDYVAWRNLGDLVSSSIEAEIGVWVMTLILAAVNFIIDLQEQLLKQTWDCPV
jgi:hypothetical protein